MKKLIVLLELEDIIKLVVCPKTKVAAQRLMVWVGPGGTGTGVILGEEKVKKVHLAMRQWIRQQKSRRGETPRGVRKFKLLDRQYRAPTARGKHHARPE